MEGLPPLDLVRKMGNLISPYPLKGVKKRDGNRFGFGWRGLIRRDSGDPAGRPYGMKIEICL